MNAYSSKSGLSLDIYRRLLMLTCSWPGTRAEEGSLVLKYLTGGDGEPLFWCGGPDELSVIGKAVAKKRSIYLMRGTYGIMSPSRDAIQALGRYYANEIIRIQPNGPYHIGGFCEAAFIAYEIAQILATQGRQVKSLVLFERDLTANDRLFFVARNVFKLIDKVGRHWKLFKNSQDNSRWKFFKYCYFIIFRHKKASASSAQDDRFVEGLPADLTNPVRPIACSSEEVPYSFAPYPGRVALVYIRWGQFGYFRFRVFQKYWEKLILGGAEFHTIPGWAHYLPNWQLFTDLLQRLLDNDSS